jgi:cyclic-di-AMP phosphodiesterase PgpH
MNPIDRTVEHMTAWLRRAIRPADFLPPLAQNRQFQMWTTALFLSIILAYLLTPSLHFLPPSYKLGSIATRDIRADRDFFVEDKSATELKRMEATNALPSVYDLDTEVGERQRLQVTRAFSTMEEAIRGIDRTALSVGVLTVKDLADIARGRKELGRALGVSIPEPEFKVFLKHRFSAEAAAKVTRLIAAVYQTEWITNVSFLNRDIKNGILIRDLRSLRQERLTDLSSIWHVQDAENLARKKAATVLKEEREDMRRAAVTLTARLIQPNLTLNQAMTEKERQLALDAVKPVLYQVQKGEVITREGQRITQSDLEKIAALYKVNGVRSYEKLAVFVGMLLLVLFFSLTLYIVARRWLRKPDRENADRIFLSATILLQFLLVKAGIFVAGAVNRAFPFLPAEAVYYAIPFAFGPMLVAFLIMRKLSLLFAVFSSILASFLFDGFVSMTLYALLGSIVASYYIAHCRQRSSFLRAGLLLGIVNTAVLICLGLIDGSLWDLDIFSKMAMGFTGGLLSGILVAGVSPLFESVFPYTTDIKLLELANLNQPVFQRMIIEAPGTYHHSVVLGSMVEAAAESIGANSLLAKVGAYYHDIGKLTKPLYFIENQRNGENRHEKLSPRMSTRVITAHIKDGCDLAAKAGLSRDVLNIIREHHGTSLVTYFYEKARKDKDPSIRALPETDFRYPGPKPQSRESGLVLLGDVMEASSRTLTNPTPGRIRNFVQERIERIVADGQLDECALTLQDLNRIAESFTRILTGIFHHRIDYPAPPVRETNGRKESPANGHMDRKPAEKGKDRSAQSAEHAA